MSFENIQLPASLLQDLYKDMLIDNESDIITEPSLNNTQVNFLGKNNKNILVLVNETEVPYLNDPDLNFLVGIIGACKLSMADIALVNFHVNKDFQLITEQLKPDTCLLFGIQQELLELPLQFPDFQVQHYNSKVYLSSPALNEVSQNKPLKQQLWSSLQKIFSL